MLIAQISDSHILADSSDLPEAGPRAEDLRRCVADIGRLDPQPDIVIHTGDTVQNGAAADYEHLRKLLLPLKPRVYPTLGNRDEQTKFRESFGMEHGPFLQYAIEEYPIRLIALDTIEPSENKGAFCTDRLRWLDETLAAAPDRPTMLFMHHPPFDLAPYHPYQSAEAQVIAHKAYTFQYNEAHEQAAWVLYRITAEQLQASVSRTDDFRADEAVATGSASL